MNDVEKTHPPVPNTSPMEEFPLGDVRVRYFLAVCEHASFSLAAEACGVSQPSVSTAVRRLEKAVGGRLFERRHPIRMTSLGVQLRPMLAEMQAIAARIAEFLYHQRPGGGGWNGGDKSVPEAVAGDGMGRPCAPEP